MKHRFAPLFSVALLVALTGVAHAQSGTNQPTGLAAVVTNHRPLITGGSIRGSLWQLLPESATLKGVSVSEDLLVPGSPSVTVAESATILGIVEGAGSPDPSGYRVALGDGLSLRHVVKRSDPFSLGTVQPAPAPTGSRNLLLTGAGQSPGDFATVRNLTLGGTAGAVAVPPGTYGVFLAAGANSFVFGVPGSTVPSIYNLQYLGLSDQARLQVLGPVILTVSSGVGGSGASVFGSPTHPEWLALRLARFKLALVDKSSLHGVVRAPAALVSLSGRSRLRGAAFCSQLVMSGRPAIEVTVVNHAPIVAAGASQAITLPSNSLTLTGESSDDGLPAGISTFSWNQVSGPAPAAFGTPAARSTMVTFPLPGVYGLRLTAGDGQLASTSDVTITVNAPLVNVAPVVSAGPDQTITLPDPAVLAGSVTDDGLPNGSVPTVAWSVVSGPGPVAFADPSSPTTVATFSQPGVYVLRLDGSDTALVGSATISVTVNPTPVNQGPIVDAGSSHTITLPATVTLVGSVTDDGLPAGGTITTSWSVVSGPGEVTFGTPSSSTTTAAFTVSGTYVLRLTAFDGALSAEGDVIVTVQPEGPLGGGPDTPIRDAVGNVFLPSAATEAETSLDARGQRVVRTKIKIVFRSAATVGAVNNLLQGIGATISGSIAGTRALVVRIPDPGSLPGLEALIASLEADPSVWFVRKALVVQPEALPDNVSTFPSDQLVYVANHLAVNGNGAWNARGAIGHVPGVLVVDYFGAGAPDPLYVSYPGPVFPDFSRVAVPADHGYHVVGIVAGNFGGVDSIPGRVTGMFPGQVTLRAGDLEGTPGHQDMLDAEMFVLTRSAEVLANGQGPLVINTSLGPGCTAPDPECTDQREARRAAADWAEAVRALRLEDRALHITSAGNVAAGGRSAKFNSSFASAALLDSLQDEIGLPVTNLTNTLVIENAIASDGGLLPFKVRCLAESSFVGGHLSGIGQLGPARPDGSVPGVWSFASDGGVVEMAGTSMASPQVAGLAAFLWAIDPALTPQEVNGILLATSRPVPSLVEPGCSDWPSPAPSVDAFAAVLGVDNAASLLPLGDRRQARVRLSMLDVAGPSGNAGGAGDGVFDWNDLAAFLLAFANAGGALDYSRYDLNGDGYTGGETGARFDLDIDTPPRWDTATESIRGVSVAFDEVRVTDLDVLCYYAHSSLYPSDSINIQNRDSLLTACRQVAVSLTPMSVALPPGGTVQFTTAVSNAADPSVTWELTGGSITASGLYTAPAAGNYLVTARSVADPTKTATAAVTVFAEPLRIVPTAATVVAGRTIQFTVLGGSPTSPVSWATDRGGITGDGLYIAPSIPGLDEVRATKDGVTVGAPVTVTPLLVNVTARRSSLFAQILGSPIYEASASSPVGDFGAYVGSVAVPPPGGLACLGRMANASQNSDLDIPGGTLNRITGLLNAASVSGTSTNANCASNQTSSSVFEVEFTTTVGLSLHFTGTATVTNPSNLALTLLGANWYSITITSGLSTQVASITSSGGTPFDRLVDLAPGTYRLRAEVRTGTSGTTLSHPSISIDLSFAADVTIR